MGTQRVKLKDIADQLGISVGTVDRAIHGRGRISSETKKLIEDKLKELGYKPNSFARALGKNSVTRIAFLTPSFNYFFQDIISGAEKACSDLRDYSLKLDFITQNSHYDSINQLNAFNKVLEDKPNGIIIAPLHPYLLSTPINKAVEAGIPVITVNLDSKDSKRVCYVGQDPFNTGTIIGTLFGKFLKGKGNIAVLMGVTELFPLKLRAEGFINTIETHYPGIKIKETYEYMDSIDVAYEISKKIINDHPDINGIFANTTQGTIGIGKAIRDLGAQGKITAVSYDTQSEIHSLLDDASLFATVTQNPFQQGYYAVKLMNRIIFESYCVKKEFYHTRADIIVSSAQLNLNEECIKD